MAGPARSRISRLGLHQALLLLILLFTFQVVHAADEFTLIENTGGAIGDGIADDTAALQSVLDAGQWVVLGSYKTYRITSRLQIMANGTGIGGDGTSTLLMGSQAGEFDNNTKAGIYGPNAVGIYAYGIDNPWVDGINIVYEDHDDDKFVKAIAFRKCSNISIRKNNISNFGLAYGIVYVGATAGGEITKNEIHSSTSNSLIRGQITGIEFDNDDLGSSDISITENHIHDLTVGPDFLKAHGYQTDGINPTVRTSRLYIANNLIQNVGEGIDTFGTDSRIESNIIENAYYFGIKLTHGARNNIVNGNTVKNSGFIGIVLSGSTVVPNDTADNYITSNVVLGINPALPMGTIPTYGISIHFKGTTSLLRRNRILYNKVDLLGVGTTGIAARIGTGFENEIRTNSVRGFRKSMYQINKISAPYFSR